MQNSKDFVNYSSSPEPKWHEVKTAFFAWSIGSWATSYCDVDMHTIFFVKTGAAPGVRFHPAPEKDIYCILWPTPGIRHVPFWGEILSSGQPETDKKAHNKVQTTQHAFERALHTEALWAALLKIGG